jgi:hypothetical protein
MMMIMMRIIGKRFILFGAKGERKTDYLQIEKLIEINNTINFCSFVCGFLLQLMHSSFLCSLSADKRNWTGSECPVVPVHCFQVATAVRTDTLININK